MKRVIQWSLLSILLASMLTVAAAAPSSASQTAVGVVLRGKDFVDLMWDPTAYPGPDDQPVLGWELLRGPTCDALDLAAQGSAGGYHHDDHLAEDTWYCYRLVVVRQTDTDPPEARYQVFETSVSTGPMNGTVYQNLKLGGGRYPIDWVMVRQGATLTLAGTWVQGYDVRNPDNGWAYIGVREGGRLEIAGAGLERVSIDIGTASGDPDMAGGCIVSGSSFDPVHITIYANTMAEFDPVELTSNTITEHPDNREIRLYNDSHAVLRDNEGKVRLELHDEASVLLGDDNIITSPSTVVELNDSATATLKGSEITVTGCGESTVVMNWLSSVLAEDNVLENTAKCDLSSHHFHVRDFSTLTARRNYMAGASLYADFGTHCDISPYNHFIGGKVEIDYLERPGKIERNTFEYGFGLTTYTSSTLVLRDNCFRCNAPALDAHGPVDASGNYWGHESGPYHPGLGLYGLGDPIMGPSYYITLDGVVSHPGYCLDGPLSPPETTIIGPEGGSLSADGVRVDVPREATPEDLAMDFLNLSRPRSRTLRSQSGGNQWENPAPVLRFDLSATRVSDGAPVTTLLRPYTLTVSYNEEDLGSIDEATLHLAHAPGTDWEALPTSELEPGLNQVRATVDHLSLFALVGESPMWRVFLPSVLRSPP